VSESLVVITTGSGAGGRLPVELPEESPAGTTSVPPAVGAAPVDPSADVVEEGTTPDGVERVEGGLPVSDPFELVRTGVGVAGGSLVELPEEVAGAISEPVDEAVPVDRLPIQKRM